MNYSVYLFQQTAVQYKLTMNYLPYFFIIVLLSTGCQNLTLEGSWTLNAILGSSGLNIQTTITEQIFREQQIINKIEFKGCQTVAYQLNVVEDNMYINIETERTIPVSTCDRKGFDTLRLIKRWIRGILKFEIRNNRLVFMDPSYDPIFQFTRTVNISRQQWGKHLRGNWMARRVDDPTEIHTIIAYDNDLTLCQGAVFQYNIKGLYYIGLTLKSKGQCKDEKLLKAVSSIKFYQRFQNTLQLYDNNINLLFSAFDTKRGVTPQYPNMGSSEALKDTNPTSASGLVPGTYYLLLLYKRSLGRVIVTLAKNNIQFKICSLLKFAYNIKENSQIQIKTNSNADQNCFKGDQTIYSKILTSIVKFQIDSDGIITLIDKDSKKVVSLTKK